MNLPHYFPLEVYSTRKFITTTTRLAPILRFRTIPLALPPLAGSPLSSKY